MQTQTSMCSGDHLRELMPNDIKAAYGTGLGLCLSIFFFTIIWPILFVLILRYQNLEAYKMKHENYLDTQNRTVTIIHEVLISTLCAYHIMFASTLCGDSTLFEQFLLTISAGFHIYDFLALIWLKLLDKDRFFHHTLVIAGTLYTLRQNNGAYAFVVGISVATSSNPLCHARKILRNLGKRYTKTYELVECTCFIAFFICRVIIGHPALYHFLKCPALNNFSKLVAVGICV